MSFKNTDFFRFIVIVICASTLFPSYAAEKECRERSTLSSSSVKRSQPFRSLGGWIVHQVEEAFSGKESADPERLKKEDAAPRCGFLFFPPMLPEGEIPDGGEGEPHDGENEGEGESSDNSNGGKEGETDSVNGNEGEVMGEGELYEGEDLQEMIFGSMLSLAAGNFEMGCPETESGASDEFPLHRVYLDRYEIGKYEVSNGDFAGVLTWAHERALLTDIDGAPYTGGAIYAYGKLVADTAESDSNAQISFSGGKFMSRSREGQDDKLFSMEHHPVVQVSWYGAVCYCNWLSRSQGLNPCYSTSTWECYEPWRNGYRLPTEAEWERAAAWDGTKHWQYGMTSDSIHPGLANYVYSVWGFGNGNPLNLSSRPATSPAGWYNGVNPEHLRDPEALTKNAQSPAGAYDMTGNVDEWCHDWYGRDYYAGSPSANPFGPQAGSNKVVRGGSHEQAATGQRTAKRHTGQPDHCHRSRGFRIVRSL